jgi:uncharacterized protein (TIGR02421 family)
LEQIKDLYPSLEVTVKDAYQRHPPHLRPLLLIDETKELGGLLVGIRVPLIFRESSSGKAYALLFRKFKRKFSEVIKKTAFEFIRVQASRAFGNYLMLGKTRLDNLTRFADRQLADISQRMNFLMRITPVNSNQEWENFKMSRFEKEPSFKYRLIPLDPEVEKRRLYKIHIERIEDPTLAYLFREKRVELEKQLTMLEERGTKGFRFIGQSLYGVVDESTKHVADTLLNTLEAKFEDESQLLDCHRFAMHAQDELELYKKQFPGIDLQVKVRKDVSGVMVSKGHLLISENFLISDNRVEALIQHEVGTHILSYCNGHQQPLQQMYAGFAGYDQLQEGLAVLAEYLTNGLTLERLRLLAGRVIAVDAMVKGAEFIETFRMLKDEFHFEGKTAYFISMRVFRGGGFPKDALYLDGLIHLLKYLQKGGNLEILYSGKFHLRHVGVIEELMHRQILKAPFLGPYLKSQNTRQRIRKLEKVTDLTALLNTNNYEHSIHHQ